MSTWKSVPSGCSRARWSGTGGRARGRPRRRLWRRWRLTALGTPRRPDQRLAARLTWLSGFAATPPPTGDRGWPVRYAARRMAWHVLDHAWEMEDRVPNG